MNTTLTFPISEAIAIRSLVEIATQEGKVKITTEACKVCSHALQSLDVTTSKGLVQHVACPECGERDIRPILVF